MKKPTMKIGIILLGIWLIVTGILQIFSISIPYIGIILGILAVITGLILLFSRQGFK